MKRKIRISKLEKVIFTLTFLLAFLFPVINVFGKSTLTKINYEVEEFKDQINSKEKSNECLQMTINELASLENLENVAKELGLSYTSESIKVIEGD